MSDVWYYADKERGRVGPIPLRELRSRLAALPGLDGVIVWRDGFLDWKPAIDVDELQVPSQNPPPLPTTYLPKEAEREPNNKERVLLLKQCLQRVEAAPALGRINGIGCALLGAFSDPLLRPMFFSLHVFTFLWIPLIPTRIFLVSGGDPAEPLTSKSYRFHYAISRRDFERIYPGQSAKLFGSALLHSILALIVVVAAVFLVSSLIYGLRKLR